MRSVPPTDYTVANIYIGGVNRGCSPQTWLNADWVSTVTGAGWRLLPTFVGKQATCTLSTGSPATMADSVSGAAADGVADADAAAAEMESLRLAAPNVVYDDMEAYDPTNPTFPECSAEVAAYLDAFISELHSKQFRVGVYGSTASTIKELVAAYNNPARQRPDDIWIAHPGGGDNTADTSVPATYWVHHRVRQYVFKATLNPPSGDPSSATIDKDIVDGDTAAPSANYVQSYVVIGTASVGFVRERSTPHATGTDTPHDAEGAPLDITCQTTGDNIGGTTVWDRLQDGNYVSDLYASTSGGLDFAGTFPTCDVASATGRIIAPLDGAAANEGGTITVQVDVPVDATSVEIDAGPDGSAWHSVATIQTAGHEVVSTSVPVPCCDGSSLHLRATVANGSLTGPAVNSPVVHIVAPRATVATPPSGTTVSVYTFHWSGVDGAARATAYDAQYIRAPWNGSFGAPVTPPGWTGTTSTSKALSLAQGYEYCVYVRAYGLFGNVGDWTPGNASCIARPLDDRAMTASAGWTRGTSSSYYDGTWSSSKTYGAALTRTGATVDKVGILATTCATCGSVAVYVGNTRVGVISLYAPHTRLQQLLTVKQFGAHVQATITLRVASSGKLVQIDGLLVCHTSTGIPHVG